jgi:hypothetical protein
MPEMKGRSLEELHEIFEAGVPARKFTQYQCTILKDAKQKVNVPGSETVQLATTATKRVENSV